MIKRNIEKKLFQALSSMPITLLRGARQTGKTTLVQTIAKAEKGYNYLTFDHIPTLTAAQNDPVGFISRIEKPIILDEIQRVPELFLPIKQDVDANQQAGRYLLTGSADPLLIPQLGDSLAGRMRLLTLWPLSQGEISNTQENLLDKLFTGWNFSIGNTVSYTREMLMTAAFNGGYPRPLAFQEASVKHDWFNDLSC